MSTEAARNTLEMLAQDPAVPSDMKQKLDTAIAQLPAYYTDKWVYRMVVSVLGTVVLATVLGGIYLAVPSATGEAVQIPDAVIAIGSAAIGALTGLLAPSPNAA